MNIALPHYPVLKNVPYRLLKKSWEPWMFIENFKCSWNWCDSLGRLMVTVYASSVENRGLQTLVRSNQRLYIKSICVASLLSTQHKRVWISTGVTCLIQYQDNGFEWSDTSTCGLFLQWTSTLKIQLRVLI
jgi:hypothetical protein